MNWINPPDKGFGADNPLIDNVDLLTWVGLIGVGVILGLGMSWSHIRRMLSGQLDVDDVDG